MLFIVITTLISCNQTRIKYNEVLKKPNVQEQQTTSKQITTPSTIQKNTKNPTTKPFPKSIKKPDSATPPLKKRTKTKTKTLLVEPNKVIQKPSKNTVKTKTSISGEIKLNLSKVKDKDINITDAVVYFIPDNMNKSIPRKTFNIATRNKRFVPSVLVVPIGSTVTFPNQDRILHNVFSVSKNATFDLGLYATGNVKEYRFDKTGVIYVNCNVHHAMQADILVVDTPYYINVNKKGFFNLNDLPSLEGKLYVWHPRAMLREVTNLNLSESMSIDLLIIRAKIPKHLNKFGSPYTKIRK